MTTMALRQRRQPTVVPVVDVDAAVRFARRGVVTRVLTYVLAQERYAYEKHQWRLWRYYGMDRAEQQVSDFNPLRMSHWVGRR